MAGDFVSRRVDSLPDDVTRARDILREAGERSLGWYRRDNLAVMTKSDGSPVSEADQDIERFVRDRLAEAFPDDGVYGEEYPEEPGVSGRRWIIDPIDGTKSFLRRVPLFANLLALEVGGVPTAGIINLPATGESVAAAAGAGCWWNDERARVSTTAALDGAYVLSTWLEDWPGDVIDALHAERAVVRGWGDGYGYAMVATGRAEAIADFGAAYYDLAPMGVILREAGGTFTDLDGVERADSGHGLASNGFVHEGVRRILARAR